MSNSERSKRLAVTLCAAGFLVVSVIVTAAQSTSVWSGVYTAEQAVTGEKIYFDRCASCHGDDLGGRESAPALAGPQFLDTWHGKNLRRLVERIETMPPDAPVVSKDAVDVLAFILRTSEMPHGSAALPDDRARLAEIIFERTTP